MSAIFIHVSDIHFGQEKYDEVYINLDVKRQLITDAKEVVSSLAGGIASGVLVTGDIAQSGRRVEYEEAGKWLDELTESIGVERHRVQMVPGNHDLDRSKLGVGGKAILDHLRESDVVAYEKVLNNLGDRAVLFARFEDYNRFSSAYNCSLVDNGEFSTGIQVQLAPNRSIRFIGLNSALLCHGDEEDENPELVIGARQFIIPCNDGVENIVLVHHPMNWYKDQDKVRTYLRNRARVIISGHEHNPKVLVENVEQGSDLMMLAAGATVPYKSNNDFNFTYNIIEFDWDETIDGLSVKIHPRAWNAERTRFEADYVSLDGQNPRFRLNCPFFRKSDRPSSAAMPLSIEDVVTEVNIFSEQTGETAEMEALEVESHAMIVKQKGYGTARLRFFRDLTEGERVRILVDLDALLENSNEPISQGLERRLLDKLVRDGKLVIVEKMIDQLINERTVGEQQ